MAPYPLVAGTIGYALVFGAFGIAFGAVLEMAGFGDTRKLAAQFYFKDLTVLKVMFTGIAVSAVLVAGASALGLLDMSRVWVNPTYLWPGIVGGLVMGVGFILGGFCPGTSVVAAATLKLDGALFLLGVLAGVGLFGETVGSFQGFFLSSYMGRFTLPDLFGIPVGATVLLVVAFALFMFWGGELLERRFGRGQPWAEVSLAPRSLAKVGGAVALLLLAGLVAVRGQPSALEKFDLLGPEAQRPVEQRGIFVDPAEVVALRKDLNVQVTVLDLRDEHDFNLFHVGGARRVDPSALYEADTVKALLDQPASTVTFLTGHGEAGALAAWKGLKALGVANLYVIEGGMNGWLSRYGVPACAATRAGDPAAADDAPAYRFAYATGASLPAAWPELPRSRKFQAPCQDPVSRADGAAHEVTWPSYAFTRKVKLQTKAAVKGGCG
ncbi:MAG TPA: YeeE/YedE thiosulfate transporter family protein [Anaeromyxobacteraceae bacterium]|nr:YeeE/YedE thiosulfate transporter family protein [Anaeromyxobacteraceae bacterium]